MGGVKQVGDVLIASVRHYVGGAVAELNARIDEISRTPGPKGEDGRDGKDGKNVDGDTVRTLINNQFDDMADAIVEGLKDA